MSTTDDRWLDLEELARYSTLSVRTLQRQMKHPLRPLPHRRVGKRVLVSRREFDDWMGQRAGGDPETADPMDARVAKAVRSMRGH